MKVRYQQYHLRITFENSVTFDVFPTFIMRSMLGLELRKLTCLFKDRKCDNCDLNRQCAYSWLFETPVDKNNEAITGRTRASHPFLFSTDIELSETVKEMNLTLTLIGKGIEYFPYIYHALVKAGESGILKRRTHFKIDSIMVDGKSVVRADNTLITDTPSKTWHLPTGDFKKTEHLRIDFVTPYRLKKEGKFVSRFEYEDLMRSIARRMKILTALFGDYEVNEEQIEINEPDTMEKHLAWRDLSYYSSRQRRQIKLGGVIGVMEFQGEFAAQERAMIEAAELFNIGKNISFGLGAISITNLD